MAKKYYFSIVKKLLVVLFACWGFISVQSQVSKGAEKAFYRAVEAYNQKDFKLAYQELNKAENKSPNYADVYFLRAQILRDENKSHFAIDVLKKGLEIDDSKYLRGWFELAELCWGEGRYEEGVIAIESFNETKAFNKFVNDTTLRKYYVRVKEGLDFSIQQLANENEDVDSHKLDETINTEYPEYYPSLSLDNQVMIMTRRFKPVGASVDQEDFYISKWSNRNNSWRKAEPIPGINTPYNEGAATISGDGSTIVFTACEALGVGYGEREGKGSCDLFESRYNVKKGRWSVGENLGSPNSSMWESQPTLSADGNFLVFARARHIRGMGSDLFGSYRTEDGSWSKPFKLPGEINTPFEEESPFLHPDGKTLYFSSNGHPGMGNLDIFVSTLQDDDTWGTPINLGYPLNTHDDENSLIVEPSGKYALYASDNKNNTGDLDIWRVKLKEEVQPDAVGVLNGTVVDNATGEMIQATVLLLNSTTGELVASVNSATDKGFVLPLPAEGRYSFEVDKSGYLFKLVDFQMSGLEDQFVEVRLDRIEMGASIDLNTIGFETGSSELEDGYQADLVRLVNWLKSNSSASVEIIGHTDNVGSNASNISLSVDRAESVKAFLEARQIPSDRLVASGKGSTDPVESNDSVMGRAANRRVEIRIISLE
ncbi:MAG: hypothetical protein CL823_00755 [Crocinitomicaceae bacterium]|nr:hypothetical protein [Crocinitomicaceae bacterium]